MNDIFRYILMHTGDNEKNLGKFWFKATFSFDGRADE